MRSEECGNVAQAERCQICADPRRDHASICVVEEPKDVVAIERTREFRGTYHVLGGAISPIDGIGPDDLRVRELMQRLASSTVQEVIIATDPNLEGEATATYLSRLLRDVGVTVTRLASGLPVGGDLEVRRRGHARARLRGQAPGRRLTRPPGELDGRATPSSAAYDTPDRRGL